jgi:hypothetical protein
MSRAISLRLSSRRGCPAGSSVNRMIELGEAGIVTSAGPLLVSMGAQVTLIPTSRHSRGEEVGLPLGIADILKAPASARTESLFGLGRMRKGQGSIFPPTRTNRTRHFTILFPKT